MPYDDLLNTKFPWLFVLFGGFFPAISEEFLFRLFAVPFLRKLTRSTVIALIAAGYIWGFGHAGYAQQPFFIRGLEVGTGGGGAWHHHAALGHSAYAGVALLWWTRCGARCCCFALRTTFTSGFRARRVRESLCCRLWWR